ncbi:BTAD domain-containing putative transcriptional regulator [Streptomyces sp. NPDC059477]|uniref:AfsR/SARP family transcriptional regulator n=1 Tax=Streptomyces sp. NPDC059477 TaxID=3346847 RepID=UPI0036C817EB
MKAREELVCFAVLGPVRAWRGGRELDLGSPQQRVVLATLLIRRGRPVTLHELLDAVWGAEPPAAAVSVLRTYVSRLRKVLDPGRDADGAVPVIVSVGDGYLARFGADALDLAVFERQVAQARRLRATGETSAAAELLHTALGAWQGTALAGLPGAAAESERSRLDELRLATLETRWDIDVELGRHGEVIPELMSLAGNHPLREEPVRLLMLALYRSGRRAEALAVYRRTWRTLMTELGIEPGAALQQLHERILAADESLAADMSRATGSRPDLRVAGDSPEAAAVPLPEHAPETKTAPETAPETEHAPEIEDAPTVTSAPAPEPAPPSAPHTPRPAQLPADLVTFVGRHTELDRVRALLPKRGGVPSTVVISAIGGMAGIGKTALAVHWAHEVADRFPDGQLCINLRGFDPTGAAVAPSAAIRVFLDALGVPPEQIPAGLGAQAALYRSLLDRRRMLILLDNARDTEQVRPLLPGARGCLVIVTSRNQLTGLVVGEGAHPLTLYQLTAAEAHDLLARRLGGERLAAEPDAAEEIVARCARLPLALAIVAAHAAAHPGFPLSAIAEELRGSHGSLDAFAAGEDLSTDVRAVFSWSYQALSAPAARLFRLLGLHRGPDLSAPAAAALTGLPVKENRRLLAELTRAHLLTEHVPGRYAPHDLLRVYAAERVTAEESDEERERAGERLLAWYLHTADAAYPHLTPKRPRVRLDPPPPGCHALEFGSHEQALRWCEDERANLVGAVHQAAATGRSGIAWRLPAVLWGFFYLRSHHTDWLDTTRTGLAAVRAAHDRAGEARALMDLAAALRAGGRYDEAVQHLLLAMRAFREVGDVPGRASTVGNLGDAHLRAGRLGKAVEYIRRGLALSRYLGNAWAVGIALANLGDAYQRQGRSTEAVECLGEALEVLRAEDNRWVEGVVLDLLGTVHAGLDRPATAIEYYHQALRTHHDVGNRWGEADTLTHLGEVELASGDRAAARVSWERALEILAGVGHQDAEGIRERLKRL